MEVYFKHLQASRSKKYQDRKLYVDKKSRIHRLFFDYFITPYLIRAGKPDVIISLQNICVACRGIPQILYVQQSIPFSTIRFSIRTNPREWIYQNILSKGIYKSIKRANVIVVQTDWMKKAIISRTGVPSEKILVTQPRCNIPIHNHYRDTEQSKRTFFYPAALASYKNHRIIVEAAKQLILRGITDFRIFFTIDRAEAVGSVMDEVEQIHCIGSIPYETVLEYYANSVLLFPSKLESFGLPLLEAGLSRTRVLASDMPFSHEVLDGYENTKYFQADSSEELADLMEATMNGDIVYIAAMDEWYGRRHINTGWQSVLELLRQPGLTRDRQEESK